MSDWLLIRARRVKVATHVLYLLVALAVVINVIDMTLGVPGDYRLMLLALPLVPAILFLARYYNLHFLPNFAVVGVAFAGLVYAAMADPLAPATLLLFVASPMVFLFLTNLRAGSLLSLLVLLLYGLALVLTPGWQGSGETALLVQGLSIYILVALLAWLYERDWLAIESRLLVNSDIDFLTQIHNRRGLTRMLQKDMADAMRYRHELAVIMFELDGYEQLSTEYGQQACDQMLIELAGLVARHIRAGDTLGRWESHRFMLLAPNTGLAGASRFAEKLRHLLKSYYFEGIGHIAASFGVVMLEHDSMADLLEHAEQALVQARDKGDSVYVLEP